MALSCSDLKDELSSLLDGELDQHSQSAIADHLTICSTCQADHDGYKRVGKLLKSFHSNISEAAPDISTAVSLKLPTVCECIQEDLSAYLDGELIAPAKEGVAAHLETCSACLMKFNQLSKVTGLLSKGLGLPETVEVDIWSQVKSRLNDDCVLIRSELSAFIDTEVATLRHRAITQHITECADCKHDFNSLSETGDLIRSNYQPQFAEDFDLWEGVKGRLNVVPLELKEKNNTVKPFAAPARRRLYAVAAVVVAGLAATMAMFMYTQSPQNPQIQPVTAEAYLIDQSLGEPADVAEAVVYEHQ